MKNKASGGSQPRKEEGASHLARRGKNAEAFLNRKLYEKSDFNAAEPDEINRHWLLHGRSDFEQTEFDCIRLFNAVQSLYMIVNKEAKRAQAEEV